MWYIKNEKTTGRTLNFKIFIQGGTNEKVK